MVVRRFKHLLIVNETNNAVCLAVNLQSVPLARLVMRARHRTQNGPRKYIRSIETGEAKLAASRVETIVAVIAVTAENETCRAGFVIQLHADRELERSIGDLALPEKK